ncbi:hypothetical protein [Bradyrhizobium sp. BRP56]|uniref:hypothetical protein n=1 Tax=Bradyrhizobium sp. BRP56 TaxID=2793819 RepID=UPI001CD3A66C|nr:hypothetical protein [Bradyrhizobium sp. BRP56]MCA1399096.1 hypothetical protein [Bradyrhizobium sp. BRP56]
MSEPPLAIKGGGTTAALLTAPELRNWVIEVTGTWTSVLVVTLNCRSLVRADDGTFVEANETRVRRSIVHFGNLVDRAVHGRLVQRFDRRVARIPFLECGADRGWHGHLLIEPPYFMMRGKFIEVIEQSWSKCEWGSTCHIREGDEGSASYLTKARSKAAMEVWTDTLIVEGVVLSTK